MPQGSQDVDLLLGRYLVEVGGIEPPLTPLLYVSMQLKFIYTCRRGCRLPYHSHIPSLVVSTSATVYSREGFASSSLMCHLCLRRG